MIGIIASRPKVKADWNWRPAWVPEPTVNLLSPEYFTWSLGCSDNRGYSYVVNTPGNLGGGLVWHKYNPGQVFSCAARSSEMPRAQYLGIFTAGKKIYVQAKIESEIGHGNFQNGGFYGNSFPNGSVLFTGSIFPENVNVPNGTHNITATINPYSMNWTQTGGGITIPFVLYNGFDTSMTVTIEYIGIVL